MKPNGALPITVQVERERQSHHCYDCKGQGTVQAAKRKWLWNPYRIECPSCSGTGDITFWRLKEKRH